MKKQLSLIILGILLISMTAFLPNDTRADTPTQYNTAIVNTANRLVAIQSPTDYGWDWVVTSEPPWVGDNGTGHSDQNLYGVVAFGLTDAYLLTGNSTYLAAAENAAGYMMSVPANSFFNAGWGYSFDYEFLMQLAAASGNSNYANYAEAAWAWQKANVDRYADGNQSLLWAHVQISGYPAYAFWDIAPYGLAALAMGDTVWAQQLAALIDTNMATLLSASRANDYADMAMGAVLQFLVTLGNPSYASDIASLKTALEADQFSDGSWGFGSPPGDPQTTAYVVMGLWAAGDYSVAQNGAAWLVADQGTNGAPTGGWWEWPDEISEVDSEGLQAIFAATSYASALYISPASVTMTPSQVGSTFTVSVNLSNFGNLMGFDIQLTWDNSLITLQSVDTTPLNTLWPSWDLVYMSQSAGSYELAATSISTSASNTATSILFTLTFQVATATNFQLSTSIHFAVVKLSDNATPTPNPIIPTTVTDGSYTVSGIVPSLTFTVQKYNKETSTWVPVTSPYDFECSNNFTVSVSVNSVVSLTGYDLTIDYNSTLVVLAPQPVQAWGIFGTGTAANHVGVSGASSVEISGSGSAWTGSGGLLFTLQFNVQFAATPDHIWNVKNLNYETFQISVSSATLSFTGGTITTSGINMPTSLNIEIDFIRGDVDCNGVVNLADISDIAYYYNQPASVKPQYDLDDRGVIDIFDIVTAATNFGYSAS